MNSRFAVLAIATLVSFSAMADTRIGDYVPLVKYFTGSAETKANLGDHCTLMIHPANGGDGHVAVVDAGPASAMRGAKREFRVSIENETSSTLKISGRVSYQYYPGQPEVRNLRETIALYVDKKKNTATYIVRDGKTALDVCADIELR